MYNIIQQMQKAQNEMIELAELDDERSVSSTENDVTSNQLQLVSNFAKTCGFKGLMDYDTEVSARTLKSIGALNKLNRYAKDIDRLFPVHEINLRRTDYQFTSETLAMNVLRSLLTFVGIRWTSRRTRDTIYISLVPEEHHERVMTIVKEQLWKPATALTAREFEIPLVDCLFPVYHKENPDLLITDEIAPWLLNDTKKLVFLGVYENGVSLETSNLFGCGYAISTGGNKIYESTLKPNTNLYATKCVPWGQLNAMRLEIYINTGDKRIQCTERTFLRFSLKPYVSNLPPPQISWETGLRADLISVNWQTKSGSPAYLRFKYGMCSLTKSWDDQDTLKDYSNLSLSRSTVGDLEIGRLAPSEGSDRSFVSVAIKHLVYSKPQLDVVLGTGYTKFVVDASGVHSRPLHDYIRSVDIISDFKLKKLDGLLLSMVQPNIELVFTNEFGKTNTVTLKDAVPVDENSMKFTELSEPDVISVISIGVQNSNAIFTVRGLPEGMYVLEYACGLLHHEIRAKAAREKDIKVNLVDLMSKLKAEEPIRSKFIQEFQDAEATLNPCFRWRDMPVATEKSNLTPFMTNGGLRDVDAAADLNDYGLMKVDIDPCTIGLALMRSGGNEMISQSLAMITDPRFVELFNSSELLDSIKESGGNEMAAAKITGMITDPLFMEKYGNVIGQLRDALSDAHQNCRDDVKSPIDVHTAPTQMH